MNPINHLIVLMMENRSFDHALGWLGQTRAEIDGIPEGSKRSNPAADGTQIEQSCIDGIYDFTLPHDHRTELAQYNDGAMNGFVATFQKANPGVDPRIPMGYYTGKTVPVLHALASRFTVCQRWFASALSSTWPNRKYFHSGTRDEDNETQTIPMFPGFLTTPLYGALERTPDPGKPGRNLSWHCYFSDLPFLAFWYEFAAIHSLTHFSHVAQFVDDCRAGTLPNIAIIDPPFTLADDHPPHDPCLGEKFIGLITDALTTSQSWADSALLIVYDEHGGFYDHVAPPQPPSANEWNDAPYGFRIPAVIVSPYTARSGVSNTVFDHTSFLKSISERWNVDFSDPKYGQRWKSANSVWGCFDFGKPGAPTGIYTAIERESTIASLNWDTGVYARLRGDTNDFQTFLERIFVLPELKALDRRTQVFDVLSTLERKVVAAKRMHEGLAASLEQSK